MRVKISKTNSIFDRLGPSLEKMLTLNQTIDCLEIDSIGFYTILNYTSYLSFLTTGLSHNTSLQELSIPIPLSSTNYEHLKVLFKVISNKNMLTELKLDFALAQSHDSFVPSDCIEREQVATQMLQTQGLPLITDLLKSRATIRLLHLQCSDILFCKDWLPEDFLGTLNLYPSLQYVGITFTTSYGTYMENNTIIPLRSTTTIHIIIKI